MPRNVRNFWLDAQIDGRKETLSGGPVSKEGGLDVKIYMRDKGEVSHALSVKAYIARGKLVLSVWSSNQDKEVYHLETER